MTRHEHGQVLTICERWTRAAEFLERGLFVGRFTSVPCLRIVWHGQESRTDATAGFVRSRKDRTPHAADLVSNPFRTNIELCGCFGKRRRIP